MPDNIEGFQAPKDEDAVKALADLENEGAVITGKEPAPSEPPVEPKPEAPKEPAVEPKEPEPRTPTMVEAWKLKVAEDQKASAEQKVIDLEAKLTKLSEQPSVTQTQKADVDEEIKAIADESGVDAGFLTKFADTILKRSANKIPDDITKTVQQLTEERELMKQEQAFDQEFVKDVLPLVKDKYQLTDEALSQLKDKVKDLAFSETYAKVPLAKILLAEADSLDLHSPRKSSEAGGGVKSRATYVDIDNITEEEFAKLSPEQVEEFMAKKSNGTWQLR